MSLISYNSLEKNNIYAKRSVKYKKRHLLVVAKLQGQLLLLDKSISH